METPAGAPELHVRDPRRLAAGPGAAGLGGVRSPPIRPPSRSPRCSLRLERGSRRSSPSRATGSSARSRASRAALGSSITAAMAREFEEDIERFARF